MGQFLFGNKDLIEKQQRVASVPLQLVLKKEEPIIVYVEKLIEVPVEKIVELIKYIDVVKEIEVIKEVPVEVIKEIEVEVEKIKEVSVEVIKEIKVLEEKLINIFIVPMWCKIALAVQSLAILLLMLK